jgi:endo-cleaving rubber dioxygenase
LPLGYAQGRDKSGKYNGHIGLTCFSCHAGQIGAGEISGRDGNGNGLSYGANEYGSFMGLPNTNTELGVLIADLLHAEQYENFPPGAEQFPARPPAFGYIPLVNTTRGSNAADTEIEAIVIVRDFDTLEFSHVLTDPLHGNTGDQDPPAWWWLHNKTRYLWFGGHSTDSSRGNMYFGSVNGLSGEEVKKNEGIFESVHDWSLSVEAPAYPGPVNTALAEQGAILFHEKDLWAEEDNANLPRPKGNGACAGCHGAYSPRYANDPRFLPDPKLAGTTGYTVPIEIINTDPAQAEGWAATIRPHVSTFWWSYPDATPDYLFPELKDPITELVDDYAFTDGANGPNTTDQLGRNFDRLGLLQPLHMLITTLGAQSNPITGLPLGENLGRVTGACSFEEKTVGYVTPPLHGVWASAPYFHNGSVPDVWSVLKPSDRPKVWRRQSKTTPNMLVNAFEHRLTGDSGAYDFARLGWKHDVLVCGDGGQGVPYYQCQGPQDVPPELQWTTYTANGGLLWPMWVVPPPVGEQGLEDRKIMNSNLYSKRNSGHEFTQALTDAERLALLEYLKTL